MAVKLQPFILGQLTDDDYDSMSDADMKTLAELMDMSLRAVGFDPDRIFVLRSKELDEARRSLRGYVKWYKGK